jgi:hypothetical protein
MKEGWRGARGGLQGYGVRALSGKASNCGREFLNFFFPARPKPGKTFYNFF